MERTEVRKIQKVALEILIEIDRICQKNDIEYILACGTALGAVRHQGFIPWDDDLDIGMTRENYAKFLLALKQDLKEDYYYHCFETDHRYNVLLPNMKVRKKGTFIKERNALLKHHCDGDGLFVDVFIYDHISENKWINGLFRCWMYLQFAWLFVLDNLHICPVFLKKLYLNSAQWYDRIHCHSRKFGVTMTYVYNKPSRQQVYWEEDLFPTQMMPFEGRLFPMPHDPDAFLKVDIGDDYMTLPPINKQTSKHTVTFSVTSDHEE